MFTNTVDIKYIEYMESKPIRTLEIRYPGVLSPWLLVSVGARGGGSVPGPGPSGAVEHGPRSRHQWRPTANGALAAGTRHCWPGGYYGATMFTDTLLPGPGHTARIFVHIKMLSSAQSERIPTVMCHPLCTMDSSLNADLCMEK